MRDSAKTPASMASLLKRLPSVEQLVADTTIKRACEFYGRPFVTNAAREVLENVRAQLLTEDRPSVDVKALAWLTRTRIEEMMTASLTPVFNLTGTVLHTNLGRAPLPPEAMAAMAAVATQASNLEYDVATGKRGERDDHVADWLCRLTGAEAALVVNNNAAAVLLFLNSLANRRQVAVSRGELIEIGGAFRLPDIMARAGCNWQTYGDKVRLPADIVAWQQSILCDPQTSGGLLIACAPHKAESVLDMFHESGFAAATRIGDMMAGKAQVRELSGQET